MMKSNALTFDVNLDPEGSVIDLDGLYAALAQLKDSRCARGIRYSLVTILVWTHLDQTWGLLVQSPC